MKIWKAQSYKYLFWTQVQVKKITNLLKNGAAYSGIPQPQSQINIQLITDWGLKPDNITISNRKKQI